MCLGILNNSNDLSANPPCLADELSELLRSNARRYFPGLPDAPINVSLRSGRARVRSSMFRYTVGAGDTRHKVLVKTPGPVETEPAGNRPMLFERAGPKTRFANEYTALSEIEHEFSELNDDRFASVRTLDFLKDYCAIVMEQKDAASLNKLLLKANRLQHHLTYSSIGVAVSNAGAWLKTFHSEVVTPQSHRINETREKFKSNNRRFIEYLIAAGYDSARLTSIGQQIAQEADARLPATLTTAIGHGDFAPRNILVGSGAQVSVIDTRGMFRPPIYEDIGLFLMAIHTTKVQAFSYGVAFSERTLARLEEEFLCGYFGCSAVPRATVSLFVIQSLLDRWCAYAERLAFRKRAGRKLLASSASRRIESAIQREVDQRLAHLESLPSGP